MCSTKPQHSWLQWEECLFGGFGAMCAGFFTNPLEVIKTRIQLQGELRHRGEYKVHYRNVFHAFYTVAKNESFISLQKGLVPALWHQFSMNGCRLGCYQLLDNCGATRDPEGHVIFYRSILCGASAGILGSYISSPFFLVKTRLQAKSGASIAVGYQHEIHSMTEGLKKIFAQHGITGLWHGATASIMRVAVGSSVQLTTFSTIKTHLDKNKYIDASHSWIGTIFSAICAGSMVSLAMTPFDVVATRLYNQPVDPTTGRGRLYSGIFDCMGKIFRSEGILAFYKGLTASFIRIGPHTVLSLSFWQFFRNQYYRYFPKHSE